MEPIQILFLIGAALILGSAVMVVTRRNLIHAALFLILALSGVAMIFVLLEAFTGQLFRWWSTSARLRS